RGYDPLPHPYQGCVLPTELWKHGANRQNRTATRALRVPWSTVNPGRLGPEGQDRTDHALRRLFYREGVHQWTIFGMIVTQYTTLECFAVTCYTPQEESAKSRW